MPGLEADLQRPSVQRSDRERRKRATGIRAASWSRRGLIVVFSLAIAALAARPAGAVPSRCTPMPHPGDGDIDPTNDYGNLQLIVETTPGGADVFLGGTPLYPGRYLGTTDPTTGMLTVIVYNLREGKHQLLIRAPNHADHVRTLPFNHFTELDVIDYSGPSKIALYFRILEEYSSYEIPTVDKADPASGGVLSVGAHAAPTAVDLDANATRDLIVGNQAGEVSLFRNFKDYDAGTDFGHPEKLGTTKCKNGQSDGVPGGESNECVRLTSGGYAKPFVVDWNNDGLMDLIVGSQDGRVYLYWGIHDKVAPFDTPREVQSFCYLGDVIADLNADYTSPTCGGLCANASPWVVDWDGDHDKDLLVGTSNKKLVLYRNIQPEQPFIAPVISPAGQVLDVNGLVLSSENNVNPVARDLNYDGALELVIFSRNLATAYPNLNGDPASDPMFDKAQAIAVSLKPNSEPIALYSFDPVTVGSDYLHGLFFDLSPDLQNDLERGYFLRDMLIGTSDGKLRAYRPKHLDGDLVPGNNGYLTVNGIDLILLNQCLGATQGQPAYNPLCDVGERDGAVTTADRQAAEANFGNALDACGNGTREGVCTDGDDVGKLCSLSTPCTGGATCDFGLGEQCDDGNQEDLDGCSHLCRTETCTPYFNETFATASNWAVNGVPVANRWAFLGAGQGFAVNWAGAVDTGVSTLGLTTPPMVLLYDDTYLLIEEEFSGSPQAGCIIGSAPLNLRERPCLSALGPGLVQKRYNLSEFGSAAGVAVPLEFEIGTFYGPDTVTQSGTWTIKSLQLGRCTVP